MLEGRRCRHADEQHRHPHVHDVAAVAPAVAAHERQQRQRGRLARHRTARAHATEELLTDAAEHEGRTAEHRDRERLVRHARREQHEQCRKRKAERRQEVAARVGQRRAAPGDHRSDPAQQHEDQRQRDRVTVEPRRAHGGFLTGQRLRDQREVGAPEDHEAETHEHEVVGQEDRLAREQRVEAML